MTRLLSWRTAGAVLLGLGLATYTALLAFGPGGYDVLRDGWLANVVLAAPGLAALALAATRRSHRLATLCLGAAMLSFAAGNIAYVGGIQFQVEPTVPSPADIGYLGFYPLALAGVVLLLRGGARLGPGLLLDALLGAVGTATALAVLLDPVLSSVSGDLAEVLVYGAYPVGDLLLISMIVGALAARGVRSGAKLLTLVTGLLFFCAADVTYALRVATDSYVVGGPVDALWGTGMVIIVAALALPSSGPAARRGGSLALLAIPLASTAVAIGVLLWATGEHIPPVTVALAVATLVLAAIRTLVAFRQVERLADARRQARTDELTGLANRRALYEQADGRLARAGGSAALLLIDLDRFKEINDALGHHVGDELLRRVADRLASHVRPGDVLARLGGDEFALLIGLGAGASAGEIARRVLAQVGEPLTVDGVTMRVRASVGIAECPRDGLDLAALLRRADIAMYEAKRRQSVVETYAAELDGHSRTRLQTAQDLGNALDGEELVLHYQPKVELPSGRPVGAEALVRWDRPGHELVYPDVFLPLVEQSGLMAKLTESVLDMAARQARDWRAAGIELPIAVNLSASDLVDDALPARVELLLDRYALPAGALELEITESLLMTDPGRARETLTRLRELGVSVAVDDYGTGYSALAYLRDLPLHQLKIDRSFVARVVDDPRTAAIVRSTVELAHALDLEVVAEGVEDAAAAAELADMGCELAQGYHFSRPVPPAAFAAWLEAATRPLDPWQPPAARRVQPA